MSWKTCLLLSAAALTVAAWVSPVHAEPPTFESIAINVSDVDRTTCPFRIRFTFAGQGLLTSHFDSSGALVSQKLHVNLIETDTNVRTGTTLTSRQNENDFYDVETGVLRFTGLVFQFTVPGAGSVLTDAGLIVWGADGEVTFTAGPHDFLEGHVDAYCEALR